MKTVSLTQNTGHPYTVSGINIGVQSMQVFFCDRSIRRTVYSINLVKFFGCDG